MAYPEIKKLKDLTLKHAFTFIPGDRQADWVLKVNVSCGTKKWNLLIYDEYHDFDVSKPLLCLFLVLNSLVDYSESIDYHQWCRENMLDNARHQDYYEGLGDIYREIESCIGMVDSHISPYDYQMRSGAYAALTA